MFETPLLLAQAGPEAAAVAAGFGYGMFAGLAAVVWWPILCLILFLECLYMSKNTSKEAYGAASFLVFCALATLHIFGVVDVINLFRYQWLEVLTWFGASLAIGLCVYSPARGWLKARKNRDKFADELRRAKQYWLDEQKNSYSGPGKFNPATVENEWQTKVKPVEWQRIISVERDRGKIFFWVVFWPLDLAWHGVFQWFRRIEDLLNFAWAGIKGIAQRIKNHALKGADRDI